MSEEEWQANPPPPDNEDERPGLPDKDAIIAVTPFTSPKGTHYRILQTNEVDVYDKPPKKPRRRGRKPRGGPRPPASPGG